MGKLDGKVAFITGAARGQGRSHAVRLAQEGADIIASDICAPIASVPYPMAGDEDLAETARLVEGLGRKIVTARADVRDREQLEAVLKEGVAQLGRLDIVCANAGICSLYGFEEITDEIWQDMIDINLSGVFKTVRSAAPHIKAGGRGGAIVLTSSTGGIKGEEHLAHYVAAKHGVVGLVQVLSKELAPHGIRVNSVCPTAVATTMIHNEHFYRVFRPDDDPATVSPQDILDSFTPLNVLPIPWVEPVDVSNAILWLVSDESRYVTGSQYLIDAGATIK